jgi:hypothetical protein
VTKAALPEACVGVRPPRLVRAVRTKDFALPHNDPADRPIAAPFPLGIRFAFAVSRPKRIFDRHPGHHGRTASSRDRCIVAGRGLAVHRGFSSAFPRRSRASRPTAHPEDQAHWKLKPPSQPVTSTASPTAYGCGTFFTSIVREDSASVEMPPAVTSTLARPSVPARWNARRCRVSAALARFASDVFSGSRFSPICAETTSARRISFEEWRFGT